MTRHVPPNQNWQQNAPHRGQNAASSPQAQPPNQNWQQNAPHRGQNAAS